MFILVIYYCGRLGMVGIIERIFDLFLKPCEGGKPSNLVNKNVSNYAKTCQFI